MEAMLELEGRMTTDFEKPEKGVLVAYLLPDPSSVPLAKTMFCGVACEFGMESSETGAFSMEAVISTPFHARVTFSLLTHATKGYLAVLRWKQVAGALQAFNSIVSNCNDPFAMLEGCPHRLAADCREWYKCAAHNAAGLSLMQERFFRRFQVGCLQNNLSYQPPDTSAICLDAICLPLQSMHSSTVSYNEKRTYYVDVPASFLQDHKQLVLEIAGNKKFSLAVKYGQLPGLFGNDFYVKASKTADGQFHVLALISTSASSKPILRQGRWFFQVKGGAIFFQCSYTIYSKVEATSRMELLQLSDEEESTFSMDEPAAEPAGADAGEEEEWVFVADDSSAAGRKGRAQLVAPVPEYAPGLQRPPSVAGAVYPGATDAISIPAPGRSPSCGCSSDDQLATSECAGTAGRLAQSEVVQACRQQASSAPGEGNMLPAAADAYGAEPPHQFFCPITKLLMYDPVVAGDGHSYELKAIEQWLEGHIRSPMTSQPMAHKLLVYNYNLKSQIEEWKNRHPEYTTD